MIFKLYASLPYKYLRSGPKEIQIKSAGFKPSFNNFWSLGFSFEFICNNSVPKMLPANTPSN